MIKPVEILLVEDNPADIALAKATLRSCKVINKLNVATDGEAAMKYLRQEGEFTGVSPVDLVLLDLNIPRKSGREVLAEIESAPRLRRIPIVVLTSSAAEVDIVKTYDLGANCYIVKPVDLPQFEQIVQSIEAFWFSVVKLPPTC